LNFTNQYKEMETYIENLQNEICTGIEDFDNKKFVEDVWERQGGGGGKSRIIQNGNIFEKGGVNTSSVFGEMPDAVAVQLKIKKTEFAACGLSIVIHPYSPKIPTIHMNIRYFETESGKSWFGGGIDLTPYYPYPDDFKYFHSVLKESCEKIISGSYNNFKKQCDDYFTISHRNEMRGIGGIFYDYLNGNEEKHFLLTKSVGNSFLNSYIPIVKKRMDEEYSEEDKQFQLIRRGRYVEFNLIYDRGTIFGLKTGGRTESILMSLPPEVKFKYNYTSKPGTPQFEMTKFYQPTRWLNY
jgi:coproporphyrinogen III oxidase